MKDKINFPIEIDNDAIRKQIGEEISKRTKQEINNRIEYLFINPANQARYNFAKRNNNNDPDISMGYEFIKTSIDSKMLDDAFAEFISSYIDTNFQKHLTEALDKAMEHKANAIAFKNIESK